jgi:hypothetical protein
MSEVFKLAGSEHAVRVDWDATLVSFGADTSEIHCWTCVTPDMSGGAFYVLKRLVDGRSKWWDWSRYDFASPYATKTLVCATCAKVHGSKTTKQLKTVAPRGMRK